ncbi:unnamed protein product [Thlaspi arvense]|uniref:RNase H type-1 domain-containing protein n=1 Tax=Thlaspi arvense TaxID=13288 RepID=A0AAU9RYM9_THLAR|nr:unnamed protein product [Thlaspi arvense]
MQAGLGWVFTNDAGRELHRGHKSSDCVGSVLIAEALAIRAALNCTLEMDLTDLSIKSDAQSLI